MRLIVTNTSQQLILLVISEKITAEIQMSHWVLGATQQIQANDGTTASPCAQTIHTHVTTTHLELTIGEHGVLLGLELLAKIGQKTHLMFTHSSQLITPMLISSKITAEIRTNHQGGLGATPIIQKDDGLTASI